MTNFTNSVIVSAFICSRYKAEEITRENWERIQTETIAELARILEVDSEEAKNIFFDGMANCTLANKSV